MSSFSSHIDVRSLQEEDDDAEGKEDTSLASVSQRSLGDPLSSDSQRRIQRQDSSETDDEMEATRRKKKYETNKLIQMMETLGELHPNDDDAERRRRFDQAFEDERRKEFDQQQQEETTTTLRSAARPSASLPQGLIKDTPNIVVPAGAREGLDAIRQKSIRSHRLLSKYIEKAGLAEEVQEKEYGIRSGGSSPGLITEKKGMMKLADDEFEDEFLSDEEKETMSEKGIPISHLKEDTKEVSAISQDSSYISSSQAAGNEIEGAASGDATSQRRRAQRRNRRWQRTEIPGAVQMLGRAFGAPPRPPPPKPPPTLVEGLAPKPEDPYAPPEFSIAERQSLVEDGVIITPDGPLVEADRIREEDYVPQAQADFAYAESTPLGFTDLLKDRRVRRNLIVACFGISLLTVVVTFGVAYFFTGGSIDRNAPSVESDASPSLSPTFINMDLLEELSPISGRQVLSTPGSPQHRAVGWMSSLDESGLEPSDAFFVQRYAMVVLFFATGGETWLAQERWLAPDLHECDWSTSITCTVDHSNRPCVTGIDLSRLGLQGHIPPELGYLDLVEYLNMAKNNLTGTLPPELFNMTKLTELILHSNQLSSQIPSSISNANFLDFLDLSTNAFNGSIPEELYSLKGLRTLDLSSNQLSGTISSRLQDLHLLNTLNLRSNLMEGTIPPSIDDLSKLEFVRLDHNMLTGTLPSFSSAFVHRQELMVSHNLLSGTIPTLPDGGIEVLTNFSDSDFRLQKLNIAYNNFKGYLPMFIGFIPSLREFDFSGNDFEGQYTSMPGMWRSIEIIAGAGNLLSGLAPYDFPPTLVEYDFHGNHFSGGIPPEVTTLFPRLEYLSLSHNPLSGSIPTVSGLPRLVGLDLRACKLTGTMPEDVTLLTSLGKIDIRENEISGTLPSAFGELTALTNLKMSSNKLTGTLPPDVGKLTKLAVLLLDNNQLSGSLPASLTNLVDLVEFRVFHNPMTGNVPEELCQIVQGLSIDHIGCNIQCTCCQDLFDSCGTAR